MIKNLICCFSIFLFVSINSFLLSQVLYVDRENGQDTIPKKIGVIMGLDFASDKQQNDFVELSSSSEFDFFLKNDQLIVLFGQRFFLSSQSTKNAIEII